MRKLITPNDGHTDEDQILYLKFYIQYWLQTLSDMLGWHKIWISDVINGYHMT